MGKKQKAHKQFAKNQKNIANIENSNSAITSNQLAANITTSNENIVPIRKGTNKYYYLDRNWMSNLLGHDQDLIRTFIDNFDPAIARVQGDDGFKCLSNSQMSCNQVINGKNYQDVPVKYEMKIKSQSGNAKARIFVAVYKLSDGRSELLVPVEVSMKGLHAGKAKNNKEMKRIIQAPVLRTSTPGVAQVGLFNNRRNQNRASSFFNNNQANVVATPADHNQVTVNVQA